MGFMLLNSKTALNEKGQGMGGTFGCLFISQDNVPIPVLTSVSLVFYSLKMIELDSSFFLLSHDMAAGIQG